MKIILEGERPMSLNRFYSGHHWTLRKEEVDRVHALTLYSLKEEGHFTGPVHITVTAYFKNRPLDCDNIMAKIYIDALKGHIISNDTPKYIWAVTTISKIDRKNPRVEIDIN